MLDLPGVVLPASTGTAKGSISWFHPGAVRYDVFVNARAGLSDLGWIWDVLPPDGQGSASVRMRTLVNPDDAEYTLSKLDVSAMKSHVTGDITVVSRAADMLLNGVDLTFAPLRSELLRRLSYDAIPAVVQGTFQGHLVAKKGGPLTAFLVDHIDAHFDDDRVPGAQSSFVATGLVGFGAKPTATNVSITSATIDLRSIRKAVPATPPVDGLVQGSLVIASGDLQQADIPMLNLTWTDAAGNASHVSGHVQTRYADKVPSINTELAFNPLALKALVRVDSTFPLAAELRGTVSAVGKLDSLLWKAAVANGADKLIADGTAGLRDSVWTVNANTSLDEFNISRWVSRKDVPTTAINGPIAIAATAQMRADSTYHVVQAEVTVDLKQAAAEERPAFVLRGTGGLDAQRFHVDSATMLLGGITADIQGALARDSAGTDTLTASMQADSLSAARPELVRLAAMLQPVDSAIAGTLRSYATDTLAGDASLSAVMVGSLPAYAANVSLSARNMKVGILNVRRVFGSMGVVGLPDHSHFDATASIDDISGVGQVHLTSAEFRIENASPTSGGLRLDVVARDTTALRVRGAFTRQGDVLAVNLDSLRFNYSEATWLSVAPALLTSDSRGIRLDSLLVKSDHGGVFAVSADVPEAGPVNARIHLDRFPAGEIGTFATGSATRYHGLLAGDTQLSGTRLAPIINWKMRADSVGTDAATLPPLITTGNYENQKMVAHAELEDSVRSRLRMEARVPIDLSIKTVDKRLLSSNLDAEIVADSLKLDALPLAVAGVSKIQGVMVGRLAVSGTVDRPVATGRLTLDNFGASVDVLGITPKGGRVVLTAEQDQLNVEQFRFQSGDRASDTLGISGVLKFPKDQPAYVEANVAANNVELAKQNDGTQLNLSGTLSAKGPLKRPDVIASLFVPKANLVADPLGARTALDLGSAQSRELLGVTEVPVAVGTLDPVAKLGQYINVAQATVALGDEVWVRTPESAIKLGGSLDIKSGPTGLLALDGEVSANRGTFRLDLGPVQRNFSVDSGSVRFFGSDVVPAKVGVYATNVVRASSGEETPIHVAITGTFDKVSLNLSSDDDVFSGAPESEIISLLIFGTPTFALNSQNQSTVKAVTGILLPSLGGYAQQNLQKYVPVLGRLSTLEISTAGGSQDFGTGVSAASSLFSNLNIAAGKQLNDRTFLRLNGGLCRATSGSTNLVLTGGLSAEYRITRTLLAQIGVDQGAAPCTQLGTAGASLHWQFGFDLFKQWVY